MTDDIALAQLDQQRDERHAALRAAEEEPNG
jgi:hypothetical protein